MSRHPLEAYLRATGLSEVPDGELLRRYTAGDQLAFSAVVERHGPLVWAVCRRRCSVPADAEDAFQAVFLLLAERAGRLRTPNAVGSWLFGVAVRVAKSAHRNRNRRRLVPLTADPAADAPDVNDAVDVIHSEVANLPDEYRQVILLCLVEGRTKAAAAAQLDLPEGTVSSRLHRGREMLRKRLLRRGLGPTLAFPPLVAVPPSATTAAGRVAAAVSARHWPPELTGVRRLARTGTSPMTRALPLITGGIGLVALGLVTAVLAAPADPPKPPAEPKPQTTVETVWEGAGVRGVLSTGGRYVALAHEKAGLVVVDARTGKAVDVPEAAKGTAAAFAPDLKAVWVGTTDGDVVRYSFPAFKELKRWRVRTPIGKDEWERIAGIELSADGQRAAWWCRSAYQPGGVVDADADRPLVSWKEVGDTSSNWERKRIQFTGDGKRVVFTTRHKDLVGKRESTSNDVFVVWDLADAKPTAFVEAYLAHEAPDNLLLNDVLYHSHRAEWNEWELRKHDLATGKTTTLGPLRLGHWINLLPSPSGEYIAEWTPSARDAQLHSTKTGKVVGTVGDAHTSPRGWLGGKRELVLVCHWEKGGLAAVDPVSGKTVVSFDQFEKRIVSHAETFDGHTKLVVVYRPEKSSPSESCRVLSLPDGFIPAK